MAEMKAKKEKNQVKLIQKKNSLARAINPWSSRDAARGHQSLFYQQNEIRRRDEDRKIDTIERQIRTIRFTHFFPSFTATIG